MYGSVGFGSRLKCPLFAEIDKIEVHAFWASYRHNDVSGLVCQCFALFTPRAGYGYRIMKFAHNTASSLDVPMYAGLLTISDN
jgi:hypothetical protein